MTRSDLLIAIAKHASVDAIDKNFSDELVHAMHQKIERVYKILFEMEKPENKKLHALAKVLREVFEK